MKNGAEGNSAHQEPIESKIERRTYKPPRNSNAVGSGTTGCPKSGITPALEYTLPESILVFQASAPQLEF